MTDTKRTVSAIALFIISAVLIGCEPEERPVMTVSPSQAVRDARDVLYAYAEETAEEDSIVRAHALEALDYTVGDEAGQVYMDALDSDVDLVRFTAAMAIASTEYMPAKEKLQRLIKTEEAYRVKSGYIYALYRLGDDSHMTELMYLLNLPDWQTRANAATVMGMVGHTSAVRGLRNLLADESDQTVQIRIHESLATLGEEQNELRLEGYTKPGNDTGDQIDAIRALARLRTDRARVELERVLFADNVPLIVRVAAAGGLGRMGHFNQHGYDLCIEAVTTPHKMLQEESPDERIDAKQIRALQQMAAVSLGWIGQPTAIDYLYPLLRRPDPDVQVAAAMSIMKLVPNHDALGFDVPAAEPEPVEAIDEDEAECGMFKESDAASCEATDECAVVCECEGACMCEGVCECSAMEDACQCGDACPDPCNGECPCGVPCQAGPSVEEIIEAVEIVPAEPAE
jgi:HEAT repeat protein